MLAFALGAAAVAAAVGGAHALKLAGAYTAAAVGRRLIDIRQERAVAKAAAGFFDPKEGEESGQLVRFTVVAAGQEVELSLTPREIEELSNDYVAGTFPHTGDPGRKGRLFKLGVERAQWAHENQGGGPV